MYRPTAFASCQHFHYTVYIMHAYIAAITPCPCSPLCIHRLRWSPLCCATNTVTIVRAWLQPPPDPLQPLPLSSVRTWPVWNTSVSLVGERHTLSPNTDPLSLAGVSRTLEDLFHPQLSWMLWSWHDHRKWQLNYWWCTIMIESSMHSTVSLFSTKLHNIYTSWHCHYYGV